MPFFSLQSLALANHTYDDQLSDSEVADLLSRVRHSVVSELWFYLVVKITSIASLIDDDSIRKDVARYRTT